MDSTSAVASTTRPGRLRRALTLAAGAVGVAFLLSGCLKLDMALTLTPENTVDGTVVFAIDKQLLTLGGGDPAEAFEDSAGDAPFPTSPSSGSVTTEVYDQDGKYGQKFIFSGVPLSEFDDEDMSITREGDYFVVNGTLDMSDSSSSSGSGDEQAPLPLPSSLTAGFDVQVSMTFPGEVVEHNGTLEGTTVTWKPTAGENLVMKAKARATAESAGVLGISSASSSTPLLLGVGAAALLLVAGLVVLLVRRGRTPAAAGVAMTGAAVPDASAVPGFAPVVPATSAPDPAWAPPPASFQPEPPAAQPAPAAPESSVAESGAPPAQPVHDTLVAPEQAGTAVVATPAPDAPTAQPPAAGTPVAEPPAAPTGDQPGTLPPPA